MFPRCFKTQRRERGLSYVEVMIAVVVIGVCLAPAMNTLRDGLFAASIQRAHTVSQQRLKTRMEQVLANSFATLDAAAMAAGNSPSQISTTYSDAAGTADRRLVTLYRYNGSAATGTDTGLLWIKAEIEGSSLRLDSLKSRW